MPYNQAIHSFPIKTSRLKQSRSFPPTDCSWRDRTTTISHDVLRSKQEEEVRSIEPNISPANNLIPISSKESKVMEVPTSDVMSHVMSREI